ncbi:hypothetical protein DIPPA_04866 [Diplonema papillatum]|nr:hypothetical protein DIPPA_04866 [Diplonema papillatum]
MNANAVVVVGLLAATAHAVDKITECSDLCSPWAPSPVSCKRGNNIDFRLAVGTFNCTADDSTCGTNPSFTTPCTDDVGCVGYMTHFYCGEVDEFSSFTLARSAEYVAQSPKDAAFPLEIAVYGHGMLTNEVIPSPGMNSRVPVYQFNHSGCAAGEAAIASFLVYNITLDDGKFKYKNREPVGNGFVNTCDDNKCAFDSDSICIGDPATQSSNCAKCITVTNSDKNPEFDMRVLLSYYGTDSSGKVLLSGSSNPLNFREFAVGGAATDIQKDISGIKFPKL